MTICTHDLPTYRCDICRPRLEDVKYNIASAKHAVKELKDMRATGAMQRDQDMYTMLLMLWLRTTTALEGIIEEIDR